MSRIAIVGATFVLASLPLASQESRAEEASETPAQCKARVGSEFECLNQQFFFHITMCGLKEEGARLSPGSEGFTKEAALCGGQAKKAVRPFYDAMLKHASKKPAAVAATKKAMQAFMAIVEDVGRSGRLRDDLKKAMAELELEL